jgi:hypothetical protein
VQTSYHVGSEVALLLPQSISKESTKATPDA